MSLQNERAQAREIERLKADVDRKQETLQFISSKVIDVIAILGYLYDNDIPTNITPYDSMVMLAEKAKTQLATEKKRADAAISDLNFAKCCDTCKHFLCNECNNRFNTLGVKACFEWRGVQEVEG